MDPMPYRCKSYSKRIQKIKQQPLGKIKNGFTHSTHPTNSHITLIRLQRIERKPMNPSQDPAEPVMSKTPNGD